MPNHVTTRCRVAGPAAAVEQFRQRAFRQEGGETVFDFNAFIPMPAVLPETQSSTTAERGAALILLLQGGGGRLLSRSAIRHMREQLDLPKAPLATLARTWLERNPEYQSEGQKRLRAIAETGFPSWYEWACEHWNTKWNAYHVAIEDPEPLEFRFDTAWDFPLPVFKKIAAEFPELSFWCLCYDDGGNFAGFGAFNPRDREPAFALCEATSALYQSVYGHPEPEDAP